ncbi:unnamed protein product, partial [Prorocentrum cordatum]
MKTSRNAGETFQDWAARFEKKERELLTQLQAIDVNVREVIAKPLRTWWFLRKSRLTPVLRGEVTATAGRDFDFAKTYRTLLTRFPADALADLDGETKREKALHENDANEDDCETGGDPEDLYEMVHAQFRQAGRSFKDARDLLRHIRVAQDFYPVVAPKSELTDQRAAPHPESRPRPPGKGRGRGQADRRVRFESGRDMAKMTCILCRQFGHRARDCPNKNKLTTNTSGDSHNTNNGFILSALDEYVYLLELEGIWAILDIGATRSLGSIESVENLMYDMLDQHGVFAGPNLHPVSLSVMSNRAPILLGIDILADDLKVVVDCGRNWPGLPTLGNKVFYCERLSSKRLAINLSTPQWWREVPLPLTPARSTENPMEAGLAVLDEKPEEPGTGGA